jgi:hypothetical protein
MTVTLTLAQLITSTTKEEFYARALSIATTLGLPVTSWAAGDPTRSDYHVLSEEMETKDTIIANYVRAGFLDLAKDITDSAGVYDSTWLKAKAYQDYGYEATEATFATATVQFSNTGGGVYEWDAGDVVVKNSTTGKTYHTSEGGTLVAGPVSCTFTDAGDTVDATAHGLSNGDTVIFKTIVTTTGIVVDTVYYVVNKNVNDFQVAATQGGAALPLTTNGSGTYGSKLELDIVADEAGSDSSASVGEIDTMVTTFLEVTCSNTTAAVGLDEESAESIVEGCRDKLASLSPNGPADAYDYVAKNSTLTGTTGITRSRTDADSSTGEVVLYVAGPSGAVSAADLALVATAIALWATPLCITATATNTTNLAVAITYTVWIYNSVGLTQAQVEEGIEAALDTMFATRPIGGDVVSGSGRLSHSLIEATIRGAYPDDIFDVQVTTPAGDTAISLWQVATKGAITVTAINFVDVP